MKGGGWLYRPFAGVIDADNVGENIRRVKLTNIIAFWWGDICFEPDFEIPMGCTILGFFIDDKYYIGIRDDAPVYWSSL